MVLVKQMRFSKRRKCELEKRKMWFAAVIRKLKEVAPRRRLNCKCHILDAAASVHWTPVFSALRFKILRTRRV